MSEQRWYVFGYWPWPTRRDEWIECLCGRKKQFWGYDREWHCAGCGRIYRATRTVELEVDESHAQEVAT